MGNNSMENSQIKIPNSHAHLHIKGRKSTKFQVNPMKNVGVAETRSQMDDGRPDETMHTQMDKGHFYSPPPPTLGDKYQNSEVYHKINEAKT